MIATPSANSGDELYINSDFHKWPGVDPKPRGLKCNASPGLAFIAYPEAVSQMPVAPLWSVLFFTMIILLGLDSQFVGVEGFITFMVDLYPDVFRKGHRREILIGIVCAISFLIGLSMVSQGGMYVFQLFDYYSSSRIVMIVAFFECVVVSYVYGADRFQDNLEMMYGFRVFPLVKWMWKLLTPLFTMSIFALGVITYSEISYERKFVTYEYPKWAIMIGWTLGLCSVINIPIFVVYRLYKQKGSLRNRLRLASKPILKKHQIRVGEDLNKINIVLEEPDESLEANGIMDGETNRNTHSSAISTITTM